MTEMNAPQPEPVPAAPQKSKTTKWLAGCGIGCLVMVILLVILGVVVYKVVMNKWKEVVREYEQKGFVIRQDNQMLDIADPVTKPTLFGAPQVNLRKGAATEVVVAGQMAELHGTFKEKVTFIGQILTVADDAVLLKGLDVRWGQIIRVKGKVIGGITGKYQQLENPNPPPATAPAKAPPK